MHVVFPGTFDPVTNGHLNIIERCSKMFTSIDVVIADNPNKKSLFSPEERYDMLEKLLKNFSNISIHIWKTLMVNFLVERNCKVIVRGVRSSTDYEYEYVLSQLNRGLGKGIETLLLPTDEKFFVISSSVIKEVVQMGGDVSDKVPLLVYDALKEKMRMQKNGNTKV